MLRTLYLRNKSEAPSLSAMEWQVSPLLTDISAVPFSVWSPVLFQSSDCGQPLGAALDIVGYWLDLSAWRLKNRIGVVPTQLAYLY